MIQWPDGLLPGPTPMRLLLLIGLLMPALTNAALSQEIIGIDLTSGGVLSIDPKSGVASLIGNTGLNHLLAGHSLTRDGSGRLIAGYVDLFSISWTDLHEIDPQTAQASFLVRIPLGGILGLAFAPGDVLYAINERFPGSSLSPVDLYTIDLVSGSPTLIGDTGTDSVATLAYGEGSLWTHHGGLGLMRIDPITGLAVDVNPDFRGPSDFMESLCFSDHGVMYQVDAGLWVQDTLTGVPTFVGPLNYPGVLGGVEYLPGPTSPFALGTLGETGGPMGAQVWGATPNGTVVLLYALGSGGPTPVPSGRRCAGTLLDLNATLAPLAVLQADAQGHARIGPAFVPAAAAITTHLQALDLATCATSNPAQLIF